MKILLFFTPWIFFAVLVGFMGRERECGFIRAFLLSMFLSPIVAAILVLLCKRNKNAAELLFDAKVYLDSGAATKEEYDEMVKDITTKGRLYSLRHYKKVINPLPF